MSFKTTVQIAIVKHIKVEYMVGDAMREKLDLVAEKSESGFTREMYQALRSQDPIEYGERLVALQEKGMSQSEIAEYLSSNRQVVGRYQKMGKWPEKVKAFIYKNRINLSNTQLLALAMKPNDEVELMADLSNLVGNRRGQETDIKSFPNLGGFNDILHRLDVLEQRAVSEENEVFQGPTEEKNYHRPSVDANSVVLKAPSEEDHSEVKKVDFAAASRAEWVALGAALCRPAAIFTAMSMAVVVMCVFFLTSYLVDQGLIFFSAIDGDKTSALFTALVSEFIPIIAAACMTLTSFEGQKKIAGLILCGSIIGLGCFMHESIDNHIGKGSDEYLRLKERRESTSRDVKNAQDQRDALPKNHFTKRQEAQLDIDKRNAELKEIDEKLNDLSNGGDSGNRWIKSYSIWVRIAAMLLNAYLVHLFFSILKRRGLAKLHLG